MDELETFRKKPTLLREYCSKLHEIENQADDVYEFFITRLFEEEKQKAVQEAIRKEKADKKKALQRASADKERALQKAAAERKQELLDEKISIARKFLMDGIPVDSILKCIDGLDRAEIEALK